MKNKRKKLAEDYNYFVLMFRTSILSSVRKSGEMLKANILDYKKKLNIATYT